MCFIKLHWGYSLYITVLLIYYVCFSEYSIQLFCYNLEAVATFRFNYQANMSELIFAPLKLSENLQFFDDFRRFKSY